MIDPLRGTLVDHSGVTADAVDHEVVPTKSNRNYLLIQNNHDTLDFWINFGVAAQASQPSVRVQAGDWLIFGDGRGFVTTQSIHLIGQAGATYTIKEG